MNDEQIISFNELEEIHQNVIADCVCEKIKAKKPAVIKQIFNLGNPKLVLVFKDDRITTFHIANEQSKTAMKVLFSNYLKEAL